MNYGQAILAVAAREIGVKESPPGSNTGPRVKAFLDGHPPEPWCADFIAWCLKQVGFPTPTWNRSYCPSWVDAARRGLGGMRVVGAGDFAPGDLCLFDWGHDGTSDHIGVVSWVNGSGGFSSFEGNTAVGNDSNGGAVMLRMRSSSDVLCFIRLPEMPRPTLAQRLRAAGYGANTVRVILRNLDKGISGDMPNPSDRKMFDQLVGDGMSPDSARAVIKSIRK